LRLGLRLRRLWGLRAAWRGMAGVGVLAVVGAGGIAVPVPAQAHPFR
jgi:hypothetical protein